MVFLPLISLFSYILISNYYNSYKQSSDDTLKYLSGISNSLSIAIDGDLHKQITDNYLLKDQIKTNTQDSAYFKIQTILHKTFLKNNFKTSIYTIFLDSLTNQFYFGVASSDQPFYRHSYNQFPELLKQNFNEGGVIPEYEDEHGKWLSAFSPIKDSNGKTVAIVQADMHFDFFQSAINQLLFKNLLISLCIIIISMLFMYKFISNVLENEEVNKSIIQSQNKEINQSLDYAKLIVDSAINRSDEIKKYFPDIFVFFSPKFKVGGDFYFFYPIVEYKNETPTKFYLGVFDCTGHGIPGAILSMLGISALNEIVKENLHESPDFILNRLNNLFIKTLHQGSSSISVQDGMEGCLCLIDTKKMTLEMSGAKRNLYFIDQQNPSEVMEIKGSKLPIGGSHFDLDRSFGLVKMDVKAGDKVMLCSDGIVDQFSDNFQKSKKYSIKRLKDIFIQKESTGLLQICELFLEDFTRWKGNVEQTDDATLVALSISKTKEFSLKVA